MSGMSGFIVSLSYIVVVLILFLLSGVWASCSSKRELATWSEGVFFAFPVEGVREAEWMVTLRCLLRGSSTRRSCQP